jgi:hypothetical protein
VLALALPQQPKRPHFSLLISKLGRCRAELREFTAAVPF